MKNVFGILVVLVLGAAGFGFYRGWFALSSPSAGATSHDINVKLTVDPDKLKADADSVKQKTSGLTGKAHQQKEI